MSDCKPGEIKAELHSVGEKDGLPVKVPFITSRNGRALGYKLCVLEALKYGDGRGALMVAGKLYRDEGVLPERDPAAFGPPGQVELLSASAARCTGVDIFAGLLIDEIDRRIEAYLGEESGEEP